MNAQYIDTFANPFENIYFEGTEKEKVDELKKQEKQKQKNTKKKDDIPECFIPWSWIENHCNLCIYSIDIK